MATNQLPPNHSATFAAQGSGPGPAPAPAPRSSVLRNVTTNWLWYLLVIASGFIVPRMIDRHLGSELLGIWDFGWALVNYLALLALGVVSSVNRYVARHLAEENWTELNATVNSSLAILAVSCLIAAAVTLGLAEGVAYLLPEASKSALATGRYVVLFLGLAAAIQLPGGVFNGVITGYERFDLLNLIRSIADAAVLIGLVTMMLAGYGLAALAAVILAREVFSLAARYLAARWLCPTLRLSPGSVNWSTVRDLLSFGGKTMLQSIARGGLYQLNSILVGFFLGPIVLAVYARQRSLIMHVLRFVKQYAQVFTPTAANLHGRNDLAALRKLLIDSARYGFYITTPMVVGLIVLGGELLDVWMGPDFRAELVLAILALGHALTLPQQSVFTVLMGMSKHGRAALFELYAAIASVVMGLIMLGPLNLGMTAAALAVAVPIALANGLLLPIYACRVLGVPVADYAKAVLPGPLAAAIPFATVLLIVRWLIDDPWLTLAVAAGAGSAVLLPIYWRWVFRRRSKKVSV